MLGTHAGECLALELGELLALGERSGHRLAVELEEFRFEIESLQMRRAPAMLRKMTRLTLGGSLGARPTADSAPSRRERAIEPSPVRPCPRKVRRLDGWNMR